MADEEMAIAAMDAASALDAGVRVEEENRSAGGDEDAAVNTWDDSEDQASDGVADNHEEMPNRSTDVPMADDMEASSGAEDADNVLDGSNPLVMGLVPTTKTFDRHVKVLVHNPDRNLYFDQWKRKLNNKSTVKRLRMSFEELLPRLMGARDYAGAAKVLEVMYHRFTVTPALCIEASLEILRRQPNYRNDLLSFYEAALNVERIDKVLILKEMWLFHIVHGEFYEAYHLYQDKIEQLEEVENDARLLANFGILCYWLMFVESKELRDMLKREDMENEEDEDEELNAADATGFYASESIESVIESNYLFKTPIGVHILYQHACNALRRAVALSPNSAMFVEYYVQLLVLVGDIQPACDYLEAFYHMNPEDPHGPRMLGRFLGCYYPDSVDAQIAVLSRMTANMAVHAPFHAMPFTHVIVEEDNNQKDPPLPVFKGSSDTMRVIDRKSIVEREAAGEKTEVVVTREGGTEDVDARFLEELYEALELEVGHSKASDKRSQRKRKADDISTSTPELIPAFVGMVEEEVFNKPDASLPHIYSTIYQKLRRTDMLVPTSKVVAHCVDFFRRRLKDGGLLIRYEEFIIPFMRRQRDKGMFEISTDVAKRAIEEMKRVWPSPPPHVPDEKLVQEAMRRKAPMLSRERRLQLLELKKTLQPVLRELVYVEEKKFVDVVYSVCKQNGLLGVLNRFDIAHAVQTMLPMHYFRVLQSVPSYLLEIITSPTFRMDCNTVEEILEKLKTKVKRSPTEEVKTLLWVEKYEALYGPIIGDENESGSSSDTGSDSEP
ncbi:hypothetical protein JG687_00004607 [Phytophthora cactorum]|uniref:Uncharacterized protein n=1 Tax=Phytophthora cactorum TaxID=29920 RepID=A0A8T1UR24_9STRA|nr:hypothetical protein JG687_00004607 [Phytophthora cactorum]